MNIEKKGKYIPLLKTLQKLKGDEFSNLVDHLDDGSVDSICECVYNLVYKDLNIPSKKRNHVKKYLKSNCSVHRLKTIANKKNSVFKRRRALKQEGKGLPFLLATALPFLANLIFGK